MSAILARRNQRASDGSGVDVPVAKFEKSESNRFTVASWSRAGVLIFNVLNKNGDMDLWTLSMSGDRTRRVFVSSKQNELNGTFSPDGRWVAYQSNASGRNEIVVRPFPDKDRARRPYAVDKSGQRFLLKVGPEPQMVAVMDWRTLLDR